MRRLKCCDAILLEMVCGAWQLKVKVYKGRQVRKHLQLCSIETGAKLGSWMPLCTHHHQHTTTNTAPPPLLSFTLSRSKHSAHGSRRLTSFPPHPPRTKRTGHAGKRVSEQILQVTPINIKREKKKKT